MATIEAFMLPRTRVPALEATSMMPLLGIMRLLPRYSPLAMALLLAYAVACTLLNEIRTMWVFIYCEKIWQGRL